MQMLLHRSRALGTYPTVSLKQARLKRDAARGQLANGIDPGANRKAARASQAGNPEDGFEVVAREWYGKFAPVWFAGHADKILRRLERDVFPWLGKKPIGGITAPELPQALRRVENRKPQPLCTNPQEPSPVRTA